MSLKKNIFSASYTVNTTSVTFQYPFKKKNKSRRELACIPLKISTWTKPANTYVDE